MHALFFWLRDNFITDISTVDDTLNLLLFEYI